MPGKIAVCRLLLTLVAVGGVFAACSAERIVYPVRDRLLLESLNGTWDFRFAGESDWRSCVVPGCWETQGLAWPSYSTGISAMTGCYHRVFAYNPEWKGRHVFLRFDGVMYGTKFGDGQGLESTNGREWKGTFHYAAVRVRGLAPAVADRPFTRCYGW